MTSRKLTLPLLLSLFTAAAPAGADGDRDRASATIHIVAGSGSSGPRVVRPSEYLDLAESYARASADVDGLRSWNLRARTAVLGVHVIDVTAELRLHWGAQEDRGVLVGRVEEDSAAARAGIRVGDLLTAVDGEPLESSVVLRAQIRPRDHGEQVNIELVRAGEATAVVAELVVVERPQVDLSPLLQLQPGPSGLTYSFDARTLAEAGQRLRALAQGQDWSRWVHTVPRTDQQLQDRLRTVEKRLQELERRLRMQLDE